MFIFSFYESLMFSTSESYFNEDVLCHILSREILTEHNWVPLLKYERKVLVPLSH